MKISIAMATYNGAAHLQEQLVSFAAQDRLPDELIVCDDGSTDRSVSIVNEFCKNAPFNVVLVKNEKNLGFTRNFEQAAALCKGQLIFFADQDDVWFPQKISRIIYAFQGAEKKRLFIHDGILVDESLRWYGATKYGQLRAGWGDKEIPVTGSLTIMHSELKDYVFPIPAGIIGHDGWIHSIAGLLNTREVIDAPLQAIRRHSSNTSSWIGSSFQTINRMAVFRDYAKRSAATSYNDRIYFNEALQRRIKSIESIAVPAFGSELITAGSCPIGS